jgi:3-phosphoshikimate 1-carboxyvinyltransferase
VNLKLQQSKPVDALKTIKISGSKSETNRLLLLQALYPEIKVENTSNSDDAKVMHNALQNTQPPSPNSQFVDVHHAGTAMRFLTSYFAIQEGKEVVLVGSARMKERPINILVDALNQLGAEIIYEEQAEFPPIRIKGKKFSKSKVTLNANVSSQYISALLLIAPKLENGLELTLVGEITSIPYIKMTLALLNQIGVKTLFENNTIKVAHHPSPITHHPITVESDWSSASYWYSIVALSEIGFQVTLSSFKKNSLQGDSALVELYKEFGVETTFNIDDTITLSKINCCNQKLVVFNLQSTPDLAQTIAVTCFGLRVGCHLTGLHTLKIKETDRLVAMQTELTKLGAEVQVTSEAMLLQPAASIKSDIVISTYQDHRMAMAFAPLALKTTLTIEEAEVVSKSYPNFWNDLKQVGFEIITVN